MKRIRLTASAIAASSLGSLGLVGIGATSAHAATNPDTAFSGKGFDTCVAPSDGQMDTLHSTSPYRAVGVYIGGPSYHPEACAGGSSSDPTGGYTAGWVQHQAAAGWGMWAIYAGQQGPTLTAPGADPHALGVADGAAAATKAQGLGFTSGTTIFLDIEPYHEAATAQAFNAYIKAFAGPLSQAGYKLGVYGNSQNPATDHSAIGDVVADPSLSSMVAAVDISGTTGDQLNFNATTNDPYVPPSLWSKHQRIHQYFTNVSRQYGLPTPITVDEDQVDLAASAHVNIDPAKQRAVRWAGSDRIGTAVAVSQQLWPNTTKNPADFYAPGDQRPLAKSAVLTRSDQFADALGGSALAAHDGGPLLLTETAALNPATSNELKRALAPGATVYLLGGEKALSPAVLTAVQKLGFNAVRVSGNDRFETSVAIAQRMAGDMRDAGAHPAVQRVLLATAKDFPDALAAGTAAGATPDTVLVLSDGTAMPAATTAFLHQWAGTTAGANVYPVGGAANTAAKTLGSAVPAANLKLNLLVGADRYATAGLVARQFFGSTGTPHMYGLATGLNWADALSGGAAMGTLDGPLLLTPATSLAPATRAFLTDEHNGGGSVDVGVVLGGTAAISNGVLSSL